MGRGWNSQGLLELSDTRYVGAGVLASAVGMDKHFMKVVFEAAGLTVGPYIAVTDREWLTDAEAVRKRVDKLGFPVSLNLPVQAPPWEFQGGFFGRP